MASTADPLSITHADLRVNRLGEPGFLSPMAGLVKGRASSPHYVHETDRVLLDDTVEVAVAQRNSDRPPPAARDARGDLSLVKEGLGKAPRAELRKRKGPLTVQG